MAIGATLDDRPVFSRARRAQRLRSWFGVGLVVLTVLLAVVLVNGIRDPGFMPVTQVRVDGEFRQITRAALHTAIAPTVAGGFFSVDIDAVRRAALQSPWVATASVRRVWPNGLAVAVTEHRAVARWGAGAVIDENGALFTPDPATVPAGLTQLIGPDGTQGALMERWTLMEKLLSSIGQTARQVAMDERRAWTVSLNSGVELRLGRDDVVERLRRYVDAYANALGDHAANLAVVDLRYTNGFAARWTPGPDTPVPHSPGAPRATGAN